MEETSISHLLQNLPVCLQTRIRMSFITANKKESQSSLFTW